MIRSVKTIYAFAILLLVSCIWSGVVYLYQHSKGRDEVGEKLRQLRTADHTRAYYNKLTPAEKDRVDFEDDLATPGKEFDSLVFAKKNPDQCRIALDHLDSSSPASTPRVFLIRGDLALAAGEKAQALEWYQRFVAQIAPGPGKGWKEGFVPYDYYPAVQAMPTPGENSELWAAKHSCEWWPQTIAPWISGSGSSDDNWLITRFIKLGALQDADREYERIWNVYKADFKDPVGRSYEHFTPPFEGRIQI